MLGDFFNRDTACHSCYCNVAPNWKGCFGQLRLDGENVMKRKLLEQKRDIESKRRSEEIIPTNQRIAYLMFVSEDQCGGAPEREFDGLQAVFEDRENSGRGFSFGNHHRISAKNEDATY